LGAEVLDIIQKGAAHLAYSRIKEKKSPVEYSELLWDLSSNILFGLELADPWLQKKNLAWNMFLSYYFNFRYFIFSLITGQELCHSCPIGATLLSENMKTRYHREQHPEK